MKSKCCGENLWIKSSTDGTGFYVCAKCGEACDVVSETQPTEPDRWACAACGAEGLGGREELLLHLAECEEYFRMNRYVPRLTPDQWAKVRWPDTETSETEAYRLYTNTAFEVMCRKLCEWAINYALQDLRPEGEE